jgi:aryl-alcohol dehydrogenase-like predicted oxidoreductase
LRLRFDVVAATTMLRLGASTLTRIGLGTNRLTNTPENVEFVREAASAGVNMIDTAHTYTKGKSEETIGRALSPIPEDCVVATKGGFGLAEAAPEALRAQIEESLRRLRTGRIPLYYLHRLHPEVPLEQSLAVVVEYRDAGKIEHVGVSEATVEQVERARAVVPIDAVQNHYNLRERRHEEVVDYCAAAGIIFVPYFPLRGRGSPELEEIAARHGATPAQITLAWLLRRSPTMLPIPGTLSLAHLRENLGAREIELTESEFQALM